MRPFPILAAALAALVTAPAVAQDIRFGTDSGDYPRDNECDDRRFRGTGMAQNLNWRSVGKDASDCSAAFATGLVALWRPEEARKATVCSAIQWGDDSSDYANDGACDDPRFEGVGAAEILMSDDSGRDASDCRNLCEFGLIYLRNY